MPRTVGFTLLLLLGLTGCQQIDPYTREGAWRPNDANGTALRVMAAVPADLARGMPAGAANGTVSAAAVARLQTDRVKPLPDSGLAQIVPVSAGTQAQPAAASPGAPAGGGI
jgi:hypothetical protein